MRKKRLLNRRKLIFKITQTNKNRQIITDGTRKIALLPKEGVATVHTLQNATVVEVTVTMELLNLKQNVTRLTSCLTQCSPAIL